MFFSFSFSVVVLDGLVKVIFKLFSNCWFKHVCQDRSYQYDMPCTFEPCPLDKISNGRLKRKHLESSS